MFNTPKQTFDFAVIPMNELLSIAIVENFVDFFVHYLKFLKFGHYLTNMATIKKTKSFGEHLRNLRVEADLTLKYVSEHISIDTSLLAKIERNERQPTKLIISQIADFFKVDEKNYKITF